MIEAAEHITLKVNAMLGEFKFRDAQSEWLNLAREGNRYLAETEPWKLWKSDPQAVNGILHETLNLCVRIAALGEPFLPEASSNILKQLDHSGSNASLLSGWNQVEAGNKLGESFLLFTQIEDAQIEIQIEKLKQSAMDNTTEAKESTPALQKETIQYEDFAKMDIRVGTILDAVKVPKADKLLQLTIDTGLDVRTVVSGIAEFFSPDEIIGKQVSVLVNLAPRKLKGIESQGMILMAESEGKLIFVQPEVQAKNGSGIS